MTLLSTVRRRPHATGAMPHHPARVPYADGRLVPWGTLTPRQQEQVRAWLAERGVDPADVPVGGLFAYDPDHDEWRIEIIRRRPDGAIVLHRGGARDGTLATVVRRVWAKSPPRRGPIVNRPARVEFAGVDLTTYLAGEVPHGVEHRRARP